MGNIFILKYFPQNLVCIFVLYPGYQKLYMLIYLNFIAMKQKLANKTLFPFFLLALRASLLFPHPILHSFFLTQYLIRLLLFPSLSPFLVIAFFYVPSGTEESSLGPFILMTILSSVDCILGIVYFFFFG